MRPEDVPEVSDVERQCFTNPWPQSAYRRELRSPQNNTYIVLRRYLNGEESEDSVESRGRIGILPFRRRTAVQQRTDPIVGFAGMWIVMDEAHITTIGVLPEYRGNGLGELLMVTLCTEAMRHGAEWVTLEVRVSNESAQALYRKYGFTQQGIRRRYYSDNGEDAYIMWSPPLREPEYVRHFQELRDVLSARLADVICPVPERATD
jgi:ribosomal-protein-alanine N-acetyltransferase